MNPKKQISLTTEEYFKRMVYKFDHLYSNIPFSKLDISSLKNQERFINNNVDTILQEFNKNNYRCDDFVINHNGKHILFTGDSYAFGCGVSIEQTWTKIIYNEISKNEKCSGYFNLGVIGNSISNCYADIFKYCRTYGNPDIIFVSLSDTPKFYCYDKDANFITDAVYNEESYEVFSVIQYQMYLMLDQYCKTNNIKLITVSPVDVDKSLGKLVLGNEIEQFDSFIRLNKDSAEKYMKNFIKENNIEYFAKDTYHMGYAFHKYLAKKMIEKYNVIKE